MRPDEGYSHPPPLARMMSPFDYYYSLGLWNLYEIRCYLGCVCETKVDLFGFQFMFVSCGIKACGLPLFVLHYRKKIYIYIRWAISLRTSLLLAQKETSRRSWVCQLEKKIVRPSVPRARPSQDSDYIYGGGTGCRVNDLLPCFTLVLLNFSCNT